MRIFISFQQAQRKYDVPAYSFWETYIKNGLSEAGHSWVEAPAADWARGLQCTNKQTLERWRGDTWPGVVEEVTREHRREPIDLFLAYLFPNQVEDAAVAQIRALGIPCVNFFCDNVREYTRVPDEFTCFDLHWVPEKQALSLYREAHLNHVYAPMPVWVSPELRTCSHLERFGVTFCGSRDVTREDLLQQVLSQGVTIEIRGPGWHSEDATATPGARRSVTRTLMNQWAQLSTQGVTAWLRKFEMKLRKPPPADFFDLFVHPALFGRGYIDVLQQSRITLGINRYPSFRHPGRRPDTYSRLRDIEAPMLGACYLTEWAEGLDDLFAPGEEIETYRNADEMREKIGILSSDPARRASLRCKGQARALADHTIGRSIAKIQASLK